MDVFSEEAGEAASAVATEAPVAPTPASAVSSTSGAQAGHPEANGRGREADGLGQAARGARRRALAAQATLFDAANQGVLDDLRAAELEKLSYEELRSLLNDIRKRIV